VGQHVELENDWRGPCIGNGRAVGQYVATMARRNPCSIAGS